MKNGPRGFILILTIVTLVLVGGLFLDNNNMTTASDHPSTEISLGVDQSQEVVIRFYFDSQDQLNAVAGELDIWEVHRLPGTESGAGYAVAVVFPSQQDWLEVQGYRVEIDSKKTLELQAPTAILDPRYYYFDPYNNNPNNRYIVNFLQDVSNTYPNITELIDRGDAWLTSHAGYHRDMWVFRITNEDPQYGEISTKPPFFMMANIHAREVTTSEMAIRYIKYLTMGYLGEGGYDVDPDVTWLVNHHVVYILVSQNPDGRAINEADWTEYWRKNVDNDDGCSLPGCTTWGVDLNRNSSFKWGCCNGSSGNANNEIYRGPNRGSEPETAAFQAFATSVLKDWNGPNGNDTIAPASLNSTPGIFISLHSYQDEILWPFGFDQFGAPNYQQLRTIGRKLADMTGEVMNPTGFLYTVDGSSDDWVYGKLGVAAFTYEIGPTYGVCGDFFPAYGCQDGIDGRPRNFWAEMGPSFVYANKIARTPYITAYGPDTMNLLVSPSVVPSGASVDLSASILDARYDSDPLQPIMAAEYFIDAEGIDGSGIAMSPSDGGWGETNEDVEGAVQTAGLTVGRHYLLVHGKNDDGIWGPFTAIFLTITESPAPIADFSSNSPVPLGSPVNFTNLTIGIEPITYAWDFGDGVGTSTETDPSYTYTVTGSFTVTLEATDTLGTDSISHTVTVDSIPIASVNLSQVTTGTIYPSETVNFKADLLPDNADYPFDTIFDFGDGSVITGTSKTEPLLFSHVFSSTGSYMIQISVWNAVMSQPVTDDLEINVYYKVFMPLTVK